MNTKEEFIQYIREKGNFSNDTEHITLQSVADAYLYLLEQARKSQQEQLKIFTEMHEKAFNQAKDHALQHNWISVEKLRSMTLEEVANLID